MAPRTWPGARPVNAVLLVSGGGFQGLAALGALREAPGLRTVVADAFPHPLSAGVAHETVLVPPVASGEVFLDALLEVCRRSAIDVVLPCTPHELPWLAAAKARFERQGQRVAVCDPELLETLLDRRRCAELLRAAGVPAVPLLDPWADAVGYPLLAKPRRGSGGRGQLVLRDAQELARASAGGQLSAQSHVFEPLLDGREELSVDFSVGFDGALSPLLARRRLRVSGGFAVVSESDDDPRAIAVARRLAEHVAARGACGLFNVQLLRGRDELQVIDVNPRLGTSCSHWIGSGLHPLSHLLDLPAGLPAARLPTALARRSTRRLRDDVTPLAPGAAAAERRLRAFAFDLDDTLVPHKRWILARLEALLREPEAAGIDASRLLGSALRLVEEGRAPVLFDALAAELGLADAERTGLLAAYRRCAPERCPPYDDVLPTLEVLRRRGYRLALLSDNPAASQRRKLSAAGLDDRFDAVVLTSELGCEKPQAAGFRAVERALQLPAEALAMVGDNPYRDVAGALAAGWGAAYLVRRPGSLYDFDHELYRRALPAASAVVALADLVALLEHAPAPG